MTATVYLIPTFLHEDNLSVLPANTIEFIEKCSVFFVENERSARRYLKQLKREIVIDDYEWHGIQKNEAGVLQAFKESVKAGKTIGIISEAGCPGVADPGQLLIAAAQELQAKVVPLVGPNSLLLALMASGLNGQQFSFLGYLPIDAAARIKAIKEVEANSLKENSTQLFIETPYRNHALLDNLLQHCKPGTQLCLAVNITGPDEFIKTQSIKQWQNTPVNLHKRPAIFLLKA